MGYALCYVVAAMLNLGGVSSVYDKYDRFSTIGDFLGAAEMGTLVTYAVWIGFFSVAGNYLALVMWLNIDEHEDKETHESKLT